MSATHDPAQRTLDVPRRVDLVVAGGGLTGLSLAAACGGAGLEVALIDREAPQRRLAPTFDGRTSAIAYGSQRILDGIGAWRGTADEAEPILEIRVADGSSPLHLHYDHREIGDAPLGYIVENRRLTHAL